jgi:hypothetical protein
VSLSPTFLHRSLPPWRYSPFANVWWIGGACLALVLQILFTTVSLSIRPKPFSNVSLSDVNWYVYVIAFTWLVPQYVIQEVIKAHDEKVYSRKQKRAKLEFHTRLGMHSPV